MAIKIDNTFIKNWDRQIYRYINGTKIKPYYVPGMNFDDLHQELRIVLINAAKEYDEAKGNAKFQTYLNRCLKNYLVDSIRKSSTTQKNITEIPFVDDIPEVGISENDERSYTKESWIKDTHSLNQSGISLESEEFLEEVDFSELNISLLNLNKEEKYYLKKRLDGYSYSELENLFGESRAETIKKRLKREYQKIS